MTWLASAVVPFASVWKVGHVACADVETIADSIMAAATKYLPTAFVDRSTMRFPLIIKCAIRGGPIGSFASIRPARTVRLRAEQKSKQCSVPGAARLPLGPRQRTVLLPE